MSKSNMIEKVQKRIGELENAVQRLDFVKRHLNQNSSEIKSQIHTSISRHLETLRNREVWLLDQVDTVLGAKEEVLHRQQARLNKALGILHSSVAHAGTTDDDTAIRNLAQALEELKASELKAEETPYIAFRADHVAMRESILSYGRVDANGLPLQSAFADSSKPSASLPRHLEEYEDSDHHVFYKTLQEEKMGGASIQVCMPKLSTRVEDWLQRPMLQLSTSILESGMTDTKKVAVTPVTQKCSIQNWLSQIKHNPDVEEEDDFEIVDNSSCSQRESPVEEEEEAEKPELLDPFQHIPQDARVWLIKGSGPSPKEEDLRAFFKHIPADTNMWLLTAQRQLESLEKMKSGTYSWFCHIPKETATWLRRAHDKQVAAAQAAFHDFFAHITSDDSFWLEKKTDEAKPAEEKETDPPRVPSMTSLTAVSVKSLKSSESAPSLTTPPQASASIPASIPDVMQEYLKKMPSDPENWLLKRRDAAASASSAEADGPAGEVSAVRPERSFSLPGLKRYQELKYRTRAWLTRPGKDMSNFINYFTHISNNTADWLKTSTAMDASNPARPINLQKMAWGDSSQWLKPGTGATPSSNLPSTVVCPMESWQESARHLTNKDWLSFPGLKANEDHDEALRLEALRHEAQRIEYLRQVKKRLDAECPDLDGKWSMLVPPCPGMSGWSDTSESANSSVSPLN